MGTPANPPYHLGFRKPHSMGLITNIMLAVVAIVIGRAAYLEGDIGKFAFWLIASVVLAVGLNSTSYINVSKSQRDALKDLSLLSRSPLNVFALWLVLSLILMYSLLYLL